MSTGPSPFVGDLNYPEPEPVRLDVGAIVARGTRMRRNRLVTKVSAIALLAGIVPAATAIVGADLTLAGSGPASTNAPVASGRTAVGVPRASGGLDHGVAFGPDYGSLNRPASGQYSGYQSAPAQPPQSHPARVKLAYRLPAGYQNLSGLVGSPAGGVWFWGGTSRISLSYLSPAGQLRSWPVRKVTASLRTGAESGFAVTAAGVAWLGLNQTLIRINTRTGRVRTWPVPRPRLNSAARHYLPPHVKDVPVISSLAVSQNGARVAVAMDNASGVPVLNVRTGRFGQLLLPGTADVPQAAGYAANGLLGIGYQHVGSPHSSGVLLVSRSHRELAAKVTESYGVAPYGSASLIVGTSLSDVVTSSGQVRPLYRPVRLIDLTGAAISPAPLPGGRLATVLAGQILVFPGHVRSEAAAAADSAYYLLPAAACPTAPSVPPARPSRALSVRASRAEPGRASRAEPGRASRAEPGRASRAEPGRASRAEPGRAAGSASQTSAPSPSSSSSAPPQRCRMDLTLFATDGAGNAWGVTQSGGRLTIVRLVLPGATH